MSYRHDGADFGSAHTFGDRAGAQAFARLRRADRSWAPEGATDVEVSDPTRRWTR